MSDVNNDNVVQPNVAPANDERKKRRAIRRDVVRSLIAVKGLTRIYQIQKALKSMNPPFNVTDRTVFRDRKAIQEKMEKEMEDKTNVRKSVEELAYGIKNTFEEVNKELWIQYHSASSKPSTKIAALRSINDNAVTHVELLQTLGLVFKAPEAMQFLDENGRPTDPPEFKVSVQELNMKFTSFIKSQYQDPLGIIKDNEQLAKTDNSKN